jgi:thioredoxin-dependent peroxiredoxin
MTKLILILLHSGVAFALSAGALAPNFSTKNQDGKTVSLSDFAGKPVLLYFYPKDETPVVLGLSRQDEKSHKEFSQKYHLPFDLLVDKDGAIAKAYGVGQIAVVGFLKRQSVLIGKDGHVIKFYEDVDPQKHPAEVLKDLTASENSDTK